MRIGGFYRNPEFPVMNSDLVQRAYAAFRHEADTPPPMSLRAGDAIDGYDSPPEYDVHIDEPTDAYIEQFAYWALCYLDPLSWRYYLPRLIDFALRHATSESSPKSALIVEGILFSLRPTGNNLDRFAGLTAAQKAAIVAFLEVLAFDDRSDFQDEAIEVLEEYWLPGGL